MANSLIKRPPLTDLNIAKRSRGFFAGYNQAVVLISMALIALLVVWAAIAPEHASGVLSRMMTAMLNAFGAWYMYIMLFYFLVCVSLAIVPSIGSVVLGKPGDQPEFSRFSWYAMMFGAGIGVGMLTYATAEPISHFVSNPDTILGQVESEAIENVPHALKWGFLHWGISAWGCYGLAALALAFFSFNRGLPLTVRSALAPLFGRKLEGWLGTAVDIAAILATLMGIAVTIGIGAGQFAAGVYEVSGIGWLVNENGIPTTFAKNLAVAAIMLASIISAVSGVGKGIKWLSNINLGLSMLLLTFYLLFGPLSFAVESFISSMTEYISTLPMLASTYYGADEGKAMYQWQTVNWTLFMWVWWIGFAPFVGSFLARISKGRSIREFVFGALLVPPLMSFIWFTLAGTASIDLELNGAAAGAIINAGAENQLFATLKLMLPDNVSWVVIAVIVVPLILTFLITSGDSAILVITTISAGGTTNQKSPTHIIAWGVALSLIIMILLIAGGMSAVQAALVLCALPFSIILALMGVSLAVALFGDLLRRRN